MAWAEDDIYFAVDVVVGVVTRAVGVEVFFVGCALGECGFFGDFLEFGVDGGVDF